MKEIQFLGDADQRIAEFPRHVIVRALHELDRVRNGLNPTGWRPMKTVGAGVREIRIRSQGAFRIIYVDNKPETVFVLHAFRKKSAKTRKRDIEMARKRLREL